MIEVREGHAQFERLKKLWEADGRPKGWITTGGQQWKVHTPSDDVVFFTRDEGGIDSAYGSSSLGSMVK